MRCERFGFFPCRPETIRRKIPFTEFERFTGITDRRKKEPENVTLVRIKIHAVLKNGRRLFIPCGSLCEQFFPDGIGTRKTAFTFKKSASGFKGIGCAVV